MWQCSKAGLWLVRQYGRVREELHAQLNYKKIVADKEYHALNCVHRLAAAKVSRLDTVYAEFCRLTAVLHQERAHRKLLAGKFAKAIDVQEALSTMDDALVVKERIERLAADLKRIEDDLQEEAALLPNTTHPDTPIGGAEACQVVDTFGPSLDTLPTNPVDHVELARRLDIVDFEAGARTSGSAFYFLKGQGALLENAIVQHTVRTAIEHGFKLILPPDIVNSKFIRACGFLPRAEESRSVLPVYMAEVDGEQQEESPLKVLAATGEIPLAAYHHNQILQEESLPIKWVAVSHCFRPETGHHGAESRGLYRVHQFTKVELFVIKDDSLEGSNVMLQEIVQLQKKILSSLGLHCRVLSMATGELGASAYQKYDIEAYFPHRVGWGELASASNCTDYQSRRILLKYRPQAGSDLHFAHTLNGTAGAVPRIIQAILENFQHADGTVSIPKALCPYMLDGSTAIRAVGRTA